MEAPTLPTNFDAEMAVIGSCILSREAIIPVAPLITSDDLDAFYVEQHRIIYAAMLDLYQERTPCDLVTLASRLNRPDYDGLGGVPGLAQYLNATPHPEHVEYYANEVLKAYARRLMIQAGQMLAELGYSETDYDEMLAKAQRIYDRATKRKNASGLIDMEQAGHAFLARLEGGGGVKFPTELPPLDRLLRGGLRPGQLIIVAALTAGGKTGLACQLALTFARREQRVLFVSLEMSHEELHERLIGIQSGVDSIKIAEPDRFLGRDEMQRVVQATGEVMQMPIRIDDRAPKRLEDIRGRALALHAEQGGIDLVIVDYVQLIDAPGVKEENRAREVGKFSRGLKLLAGELQCPMLVLSQFNREASKGGSKVPGLHELKDSSSLEQDADVALILHRPDLSDPDAPKGMCEVHVAKQRNGPLGKVVLEYAPDTGRWREPMGGFVPMNG